jgi:hypothetical protein
MIDDRTRRVRKMCDGEELVDYEPQPPALLVTSANPSLANADRRQRALRDRRAQPRPAPPPPR